MPAYFVSKMIDSIGSISGKKVLVLGASYRANVKELAFSGVFELINLLTMQGAHVEVQDPLFSSLELNEAGLPGLTSNLNEFESVIIQTASVAFIDLLKERGSFRNLKWIFDGRNLLNGLSPMGGVTVFGIGQPTK
jgi:UDP-N-acetyl-D-mannosaminuronate dehydrogenase